MNSEDTAQRVEWLKSEIKLAHQKVAAAMHRQSYLSHALINLNAGQPLRPELEHRFQNRGKAQGGSAISKDV